jgi:glyoxylase-like metal-dependent hydrolase (beta-lactamase superfamily II)
MKPFRIVNAHLIVGPDGCILVDAGIPGTEKKVERALAREGRSFKDITLIVVTHAHVDHAGNAARIRELTGAPIVAHRGDTDHFRRDVPMTFRPTSAAARLFYKTGIAQQPYVPFTPDVILDDDDFPLDAYGVPGKVVRTVGHTEGSISVVLPSGDALVGDLLASGIFIGGLTRLGHALRPPFEDDPLAVSLSLFRLLDAGSERFYMGHGGPLPAAEVRRHATRLASLRSGTPLPLHDSTSSS